TAAAAVTPLVSIREIVDLVRPRPPAELRGCPPRPAALERGQGLRQNDPARLAAERRRGVGRGQLAASDPGADLVRTDPVAAGHIADGETARQLSGRHLTPPPCASGLWWRSETPPCELRPAAETAATLTGG